MGKPETASLLREKINDLNPRLPVSELSPVPGDESLTLFLTAPRTIRKEPARRQQAIGHTAAFQEDRAESGRTQSVSSLALDPEMIAGFPVESGQHLVSVESQLPTLVRNPADADAIHPVSRSAAGSDGHSFSDGGRPYLQTGVSHQESGQTRGRGVGNCQVCLPGNGRVGLILGVGSLRSVNA